MVDIDDDDESQEENPAVEELDESGRDASKREKLMGEWHNRFVCLSDWGHEEWTATHIPKSEQIWTRIAGRQWLTTWLEPKPGATFVPTEALRRNALAALGYYEPPPCPAQSAPIAVEHDFPPLPGNLKAPGGTHTYGDVVRALRKVADRFSKEAAFGLLRKIAGTSNVRKLRPELYDKMVAWSDAAVALPDAKLRETYSADWEGHCISFADFEKYNEPLRRHFAIDADQHRAWTCDEIEDDDRPQHLLAGTLPRIGTAIGYGTFKHGKSAWFHHLGLAVANALPFEGERMTKGRVLYVTLDPNATRRDVKRRLMQMCECIGIEKPGDNFLLVDSQVYLNHPQSVSGFLRKNPGEFALVIFDSLYMAVDGDLTQPTVVTPAMRGMRDVSAATGALVVAVAHTGRGDQSHPYGAMYQEAGAGALIHFVRNHKTDVVTATVEFMKNGDKREPPFRYHLEGPFLKSLDNTPRIEATAPAVEAKHLDVLASIPEGRMHKHEGRKLIEQFLSGPERTRETQFYRMRKNWEDAGLLAQDGDFMWRIVP